MRTKGSSGAKTKDLIFQAGLTLIHRHGFEATTLRQIAAEVGIREGSLYNHIASKQDLLYRLVEDHMDRLLVALQAALHGISDPDQLIRAFIGFHLSYHMERPAEVFVINSELRSLDPELRAIIIAKRDRYEGVLIDILSRCRQEKGFSLADPAIAAKAILAMLTGVCTWFRADGRLSIDALIALYSEMILNGIAFQSP